MTREEAIELLENHTQYFVPVQDLGALNMAITALRPVSREQVEKVWRGCEYCSGDCPPLDWQFGLDHILPNYKYCPVCGAPITDEAVQMVMERLEALKDGKGD